MSDRLVIVIPCYNEEKVLRMTAPLFLQELDIMTKVGKICNDSSILFVDDGSKDSTWEIIQGLNSEDKRYTGIKLSRNRGHQNALLAGLMEASKYADITISIDCDGQDDIRAMEKMVDEYKCGCDIVYGVRSKRDKDSFLKRFTAETYYKVLKGLGADIVFNHADYRLLSKRVIEEMKNYKEVNLFLRGMIPLVGFKSTSVYYERNERLAGETHYSINRMLGLAFDGITSLSTKPLHIISLLGCIVAFISFLGIIWAVIGGIKGETIAGWASLISILCFFSGIQLICLGVLGEYIGKIYLEVKARPRYIIEKKTEAKGIDNKDEHQ